MENGKHLFEPKCRTEDGEIIIKPVFANDEKDVCRKIAKYSKKTGEKLEIVSIQKPVFKNI